MSEKKPDSETTEERLSEKISIQTEEIKAEIQDKRESAEDTAEPSAAEPENAEETKSAEETGSAEESSVSKEQVQEEEPPAATQDEDFFYDDEKAYGAPPETETQKEKKAYHRRGHRGGSRSYWNRCRILWGSAAGICEGTAGPHRTACTEEYRSSEGNRNCSDFSRT